MRPLRIAQVCADRGVVPGSTKGAALHLRGLAAGLAEAGHRVTTFAARPPVGPFPAPVRQLAALAAADVDVVYERYSLGHGGGLHRARELGRPFVLEVNAPLVDEAARHRPGTVGPDDAAIEAGLLADADLVVAVSSVLARWVGARRTGPVVTIANGVEPGWYPVAAAVRSPRFPLVFLGHPKPWHGADRIVDVLVRLADTGRRPDVLVVGGGPGTDRLGELARRAGVADRLHVTGPLAPARAAAALAGAAIGLAPYPPIVPFYFCPLKVLDYMAAGLAVVASRQGDVPAIVGDAGRLVDPADDAALAAAAAELLDDPTERAAMARRGRRRVLATRSWAAVARRTVAAMADLSQAAGVAS